MEISKKAEHGNLDFTVNDESMGRGISKSNGERPEKDASPYYSDGPQINGEFSRENEVEDEKEEVSEINSLDNISNSADLSKDSNCDHHGDHHNDNDKEEEVNTASSINGDNLLMMIRPHSQLPKPEAPPGVMVTTSSSPPINRSKSLPENGNIPAIGKFFREKRNSFSAAIAKRISSLKEDDSPKKSNSKMTMISSSNHVTEFNLSGLKVIVKLKDNGNDDVKGDQKHLEYQDQDQALLLKGRISFFSRSNCRDCSAVRSFFKHRGLKFVEINIDVYPMREKELVERTGTSSVPQIFFNEKLFGGLVALNSLRNSSGLFEERLKEMLGRKCPDDAPAPPVYGFDDPEEERTDEMVSIVRVLRQRLPIQDRLMKMKIVKNCFAGNEMVEVIIHHLDCGRNKAVDIGKQLARKHFIHHVFRENEFEDGNHFYRFLEHEPFIPRCFNFRGSLNDSEPKSAATVSKRLTKIMSAILESYASEDRRHLNYVGISNSEEFRRYVNLVQDLHRVNIMEFSADEKLAFFLNLYNAMVIHAVIRVGHPGGVIDRRSFFSDFQYLVGGHPYSLSTIKNGILRSNRRPPYSLVKSFGFGDKRLELAFTKVNPLIHFGLCNGTRSSPIVRFFSPQGVEAELRYATREFFQRDGMEVDLAKRTVYLSGVMKWFNMDFGQDKEMLKWILNYLDATKAGLLTHLLGDGGTVNIVYQNYDWSVNS